MAANTSESTALPHIVIVGAGFGGLRAARSLAHAPVRVTLVDKNNYHLFQPLLYQVATAGISPDEIAHPVRGILRSQKNLEFILAEVKQVDLAGKVLHTNAGDLPFDALILAVGGVTQFFGMQSLEHNAFGLKNIGDATSVRNHLLTMFELANQEPDPAVRQSLLTFVVVGGGPTGVETSGALSELTHLVLAKDYPHLDISNVKIILLEAFDRLLPAFPTELRDNTLAVLRKKHVDVRFGAAVSDFDGMRVSLKDGSVIPTQTVIWAAGVKAAPVMGTLGVPQGSLGRLPVEPTLQVKEYPYTFVIGDAALINGTDGRPLPMVAPVAMQQAEVAAHNAVALLNGGSLQAFAYKDPGSMATIGRREAVARLGNLNFRGVLAWFIWLFVHLMQLVGFRNRVLVLVNWAWDYFFYERAVRMIGPCL
jgi:NADH dehydrogenase, FAD-containing subunit